MPKDFIKGVSVSLVVLVIFLGTAELAQRVRYAIRYKNTCWLFYGTNAYYKTDSTAARNKKFDKKLEEDFNLEAVVANDEGMQVFRYKYDIKRDENNNILYKKQTPGNYILTRNASMHINSSGFRGADISAIKNKPRVIIMGGSTTLGAYNNDNKTYPYLLENILRDRYGKDIEIINGGVGGANIKEIYNLFKEEFVKLSPDIVTILSGYNNWEVKSREGAGWQSVLFHIREFLMDKSLLFCTIVEKLYLSTGKTSDDAWCNPGVAEIILNNKNIWIDFRINLEKICSLAKKHNIRIILITEPLYLVSQNPRIFWEDAKVWGRHQSLTNDIIKEVAKKYGFEFLDAEEIVNQKYANQKREMFKDVVHLTDTGNSILAEIIAERLSEDIK